MLRLKIYKGKLGWVAKLTRPEWLGESVLVGFYPTQQEAFDAGSCAYKFSSIKLYPGQY